MIVLGIETSCDETSVAIIEQKENDDFGNILAENTLSQFKKHSKFGGIVPELASREHENTLNILVKKTLNKAKINLKKIDAFAATTGPGLLGGLLIGSNYAKTLSLANNKPFVAVNHLQGPILVSRLKKKINFPFLSLLLSGGHTQLLIAKKYNKFEIIGETLDDALGEAFDKTSRLLGYGYPGGPIIEKLALKGTNTNFFKLPKPLLKSDNFNFSFSGLKTSIRRITEKPLNKTLQYNLANEFQECITEILMAKCEKAINLFKKKMNLQSFILAGGVASNKFIRKKFDFLCKQHCIEFIVPEKNLCVDNATMIAWAGIERLKKIKKCDSLTMHPKPRWSLEDL